MRIASLPKTVQGAGCRDPLQKIKNKNKKSWVLVKSTLYEWLTDEWRKDESVYWVSF